jgi:hypothetical protein
MCVSKGTVRRRGFLKGAALAGGAAAVGALPRRARAGGARAGSPELLERAGLTASARILRYGGSHPTEAVDVPLAPGGTARRQTADAVWSCALRATAVKPPGAKAPRPDAVDLVATFKLEKGAVTDAGIGLTFSFARWSRGHYVLLPGACYAGNRFESRHIAYPPLLAEAADVGPNVPIIVSDIPRLNVKPGPSRLQVLAADLATPAVCVHAPTTGTGVIALCDPATRLGPSSLTLEENDDRTRARLTLGAPGVREDFAYAQGNTRLPSKDRGAAFRAGDEVVLRVRLHVFDCADVQGLFDRLAVVRKDLTGPTARPPELPFSVAFKAHEERTNRRWNEDHGYFACAAAPDARGVVYENGWRGGLGATLPLVTFGDARSRERSLRALAAVFRGGQAASGFFHSAHDGKRWLEDGPASARATAAEGARRPAGARRADRWHLVRRSADTLTFAVKQLMVLGRQDADFKPESRWVKGVGRCADAFVRLWDREKQFGQFVDVETGDVVVGGSTSAALAPAGLALAAAYLKRDDCLAVAHASAEQMYERYVRAGITCGGPGDALQCPDGESAAALLESFMTLHEQTGESVWLERATAVARQVSSWVISYDHPLAATRPPAAGDVRATGAVFSNAQNGRGAPGYTLLSGDALFRLYRATADVAHLDLLRDTVHNLAQYLPRAEQDDQVVRSTGERAPRRGRADTSDWLDPGVDVGPVGGAYDAACLLSYAEVPGVYVRTNRAFVYVFDHVEARVRERASGRLIVALKNPTTADASVRVLAESDADAARPLAPGALLAARVVAVPAGASVDVELELPSPTP